jgi:hypothetical protein
MSLLITASLVTETELVDNDLHTPLEAEEVSRFVMVAAHNQYMSMFKVIGCVWGYHIAKPLNCLCGLCLLFL